MKVSVRPSWSMVEDEMANVFASDFSFERDGVAMASVIDSEAGAELLGATVYQLSPGARWAQLHVHYANEEALIVLAGTPTLHTLQGAQELATGEAVVFPRGRRGAHRIENSSSDDARVLIISTMHMPEIVEYPERGEVFVMTEPPWSEGVQDLEQYGRILRGFKLAEGRPVPPDPDA